MSKHIFILAGETSGDLHGANLAKDLKARMPNIKISGLGGRLMQEAGVNLYCNIVELAVVGFSEVLKNLSKFKKIFDMLCQKLDEEKPDCVVLIDYPGFNLRFAQVVKKKNIPLLYYISPQVWAWGKKRIELIRRCVDKMIVIFEFEERLYRENRVNVEFVGHPFLDIVKPSLRKQEALAKFGLANDKKTIGLLPGSREAEVKRLLPPMLGAAKILNEKIKDAQFLITKSEAVKNEIYTALIKNFDLDIALIDGDYYDAINACDFVIVASGSATLETAILEKPMVIIYKVSFLTWLFLKNMINLPCVGMANIVAGKKIVPEALQFDANPSNISKLTYDILSDKNKLSQTLQNLSKIKSQLRPYGASKRATEIILNFLS